MREGYQEIEISNSFNSGIIKTIKICDGCKWIKKSIGLHDHITICNHDGIFDKESMVKRGRGFISKRRLRMNLHGYLTLPDDGCPFENQIERDKKLTQLLDKQNE